MIANGHPVAAIGYHGSDPFNNNYSNARRGYYSISGNPTALFDGGNAVVGGYPSGSMYTAYTGPVTSAASVPCSFEIDIDGTGNLIDYNITATIRRVDPYAGSNLVFHLVVTESHILFSWGGLSEVNHVCRLMVPGSSGTTLDFSNSDTLVLNLSFSLDPEWSTENCELVAFIQDNTNKDILQGTKRNLIDFGNENDYDASVTAIENMPSNVCVGELEPWATIRNLGNENLTSVDIQYNVNGGPNSTYNWTGNLAILESELVYLPGITYAPEDENILTIYSENPNGNPDQYPSNDTLKVTLEKLLTPTEVGLFIRADDNPEETTWELTDDEGTVLYSGGPYSTPGATINESFTLDPNGCYMFTMYDAGGDGFQMPGFFFLYYGNNQSILQGFEFGEKLFTEFFTDDATSLPEQVMDVSMMIYPNPANNMANLVFTLENQGEVSLKVYNMLGEEVLREESRIMSAGEQLIQVNTNKLMNGMYFLQLQIGNQQIIKKLTVSR
ncbi:MAG: T9SS type A sorting domain-containing protein [Bacteroidota bacterium]|nr:T9SS type A sorting domain-containing protein [Bacteroidota bacterium]